MVRSDGVLTLRLDLGGSGLLLDCWDDEGCGSYHDIVATSQALTGSNGTDMVVISTPPAASFSRCRQQTAWASVIPWSNLDQGTVLCLRTRNPKRHGALVIDAPPNLDREFPSVTITGVLWEAVIR